MKIPKPYSVSLGTKSHSNMPIILEVCEVCSALVKDIDRHISWHKRITAEANAK